METMLEGFKEHVEKNKPEKKAERVGIVPSKFKGVKKDARRFITALELYFASNQDVYNNEDKKIALAFALCEEKAGQWAQPYMERYNVRKDIFGILPMDE